MVAMDPAPSSQLLMLSVTKPSTDILVSTHNKYYGSQATNQPTTSTTNPSTESLPPNVIPELKIKPPKGVVDKLTYNTRARAAQNYNIFEDLAQSPSAMSSLEILQNCPSQKHALLSAIGVIDLIDSNLVIFNHTGYVPQLPA